MIAPDLRWRLDRHLGGVTLHLEERRPTPRGYCCLVSNRAEARAVLPELERLLRDNIARVGMPMRTYDPHEIEELASPASKEMDHDQRV